MYKKILLISLTLRKGGAENQLARLAIFLKQAGNNVEVISLLPGNDFKDAFDKNGISTKLYKIKEPKNIFALFRDVKSVNYDIIISFMFGANIVARALKLYTGTPLITSVRNNEISQFYYWMYKVSYKIDTITTFNSSYALNKFVNDKITNKKSSYLVNNAIKFYDTHVADDKIETFSLVSLAHFRPQKDYKTLFEAIKIVKEKGFKLRLNVLGHTFGQRWPYDIIRSLNVEEEVNIIGFSDDTNSYIKVADALVLSTLWEGTPNALLEAMACRTPIISSKVPGCQELVEESGGGFLFKTGNAEDLAKKIIKMMRLKEVDREELGRKGYIFVKENYDEDKVYKKWLELINSVL